MRKILAVFCLLFVGLAGLHAKPVPKDKPPEPKVETKKTIFAPVDIQGNLTAQDLIDPKRNQPAKTFTYKFQKGRSYIVNMTSSNFDTFLRVLDSNGMELAEDDDGGGGLNSRIIFAPSVDGEYKIVATSFGGGGGQFNLKIQEFVFARGEAKPRQIGKEAIVINALITQQDKSDLGKLGKTYSVEMKAGQNYVIDLESKGIDSYLYLFDANGKTLAKDDDSGDGLNSRIQYRPDRDGVFHILATSLGGDGTGPFTLRVRKE